MLIAKPSCPKCGNTQIERTPYEPNMMNQTRVEADLIICSKCSAILGATIPLEIQRALEKMSSIKR